MAYGTCLENMQCGNAFVGSNPTLSASLGGYMNNCEYQEINIDTDSLILILLHNRVAIGQVTFSKRDNCLYNLIISENARNYGFAKKLLKEATKRYNPQFINASTAYGSHLGRLCKLYSTVGFEAYEVKMRRQI